MDPTHLRSLESANSQGQKVEWWPPGDGRVRMGTGCLMGTEFQSCKTFKKVWEMEGGRSRTNVSVLMPQGCTPKQWLKWPFLRYAHFAQIKKGKRKKSGWGPVGLPTSQPLAPKEDSLPGTQASHSQGQCSCSRAAASPTSDVIL